MNNNNKKKIMMMMIVNDGGDDDGDDGDNGDDVEYNNGWSLLCIFLGGYLCPRGCRNCLPVLHR